MSNKILIVDDNEDILESTKILLEESGFDCVTLNRGTNIVSFIQKIKPDLILLDILLSGEDGREICLDLKQNKRVNIPIILFSAHTIINNSEKNYMQDDFVKKPFDLDHLLDTINKYL